MNRSWNRSRIIPESSGPYARALTTRRQETGEEKITYVAFFTTEGGARQCGAMP